jgi:hypothetical protein
VRFLYGICAVMIAKSRMKMLIGVIIPYSYEQVCGNIFVQHL